MKDLIKKYKTIPKDICTCLYPKEPQMLGVKNYEYKH